MSGRTRSYTEEEIEDRAPPLATPNLNIGKVYWLSSKAAKREFAPVPVRARRVQDAARRAVLWIGGPVLVWKQDELGGEIVWCEWPQYAVKPTGKSMAHFSYVP